MTRGYLLDTNIIAYWFDAHCEQHSRVLAHVNALPAKSPLVVSAITLGEIEYGHRVESESTYTPVQVKFNDFVKKQCPMILDIRKSTTVDYGRLRALLFAQYGRKKGGRRWPEQIIEPSTGLSLGIQENDLWIAAQAIEHRLVLVSADKHMIRIHEAANKSDANKLDIEDWTQ